MITEKEKKILREIKIQVRNNIIKDTLDLKEVVRKVYFNKVSKGLLS